MENHIPSYRNYGKELTSEVERGETCTYDINIDLYVEGNLTLDQHQQVETHMQYCDSCTKYHSDLEQYNTLRSEGSALPSLAGLVHDNEVVLATFTQSPELFAEHIADEIRSHYGTCASCRHEYERAIKDPQFLREFASKQDVR